jgi:hypothetical protein
MDRFDFWSGLVLARVDPVHASSKDLDEVFRGLRIMRAGTRTGLQVTYSKQQGQASNMEAREYFSTYPCRDAQCRAYNLPVEGNDGRKDPLGVDARQIIIEATPPEPLSSLSLSVILFRPMLSIEVLTRSGR